MKITTLTSINKVVCVYVQHLTVTIILIKCNDTYTVQMFALMQSLNSYPVIAVSTSWTSNIDSSKVLSCNLSSCSGLALIYTKKKIRFTFKALINKILLNKKYWTYKYNINCMGVVLNTVLLKKLNKLQSKQCISIIERILHFIITVHIFHAMFISCLH